MKHEVASKNVRKTLKSIYELTVDAMNRIEPEDWQSAIRLAIKHEEMYAKLDNLQLDSPLEPHLDESFEHLNIEEPLQPAEPVVKNVQKCAHCDFETALPRIFKRHTNSYKICSVCLKVFCGHFASTYYKNHMKKHSVEKKKICDICEKSFKFPSDLKNHLKWSKCGRE